MRPRALVRLAVSIGCPCGIGPEVSLAGTIAMRRADPRVRVLLVGDVGALRAAARAIGVEPARVIRATSAQEAWSAAPRGSRASSIFVLEPARALSAADRRPGKPGTARARIHSAAASPIKWFVGSV